MLLFLLAIQNAFAVQNYSAERDPPLPEAKVQYRLFLHTPDRECKSWRKITPKLEKADILVSETKRDEKTPKGTLIGCKFTWVITSAVAPGAMKFEIESNTGPREEFEQPAPAGYKAPVAAVEDHSISGGIPGVANENGTAPAQTAPKGSVKLPGFGIGGDGKSVNPGTGK